MAPRPLALSYQLSVRLIGGTPMGDIDKAEVLATDPTKLPRTFQGLYEHDLQALWQACLQVQEWQYLKPGLGVAVNMLPSYFEVRGFAQEVINIVRRSGLLPHLVTLEIVEESALNFKSKWVGPNLVAISQAQIKLALDDVGAKHYAKPRQVKRLLRGIASTGARISVMKLDRASLVEGLETKAGRDRARQFMDLAESAGGIMVVAEGALTDAQIIAAARLGCTGFQSYRWSIKLSPAQVVQRLQEPYERNRILPPRP